MGKGKQESGAEKAATPLLCDEERGWMRRAGGDGGQKEMESVRVKEPAQLRDVSVDLIL